jgi:threonyl-tRNA synthetase
METSMAEKTQEKYHDSLLYRIRHSSAHIMAQAVMEYFPGAKVAIGPAIDDGFYYDFDLPRSAIPEDLEKIEERMRHIIRGNHAFQRRALSAEAF